MISNLRVWVTAIMGLRKTRLMQGRMAIHAYFLHAVRSGDLTATENISQSFFEEWSFHL